MHIAHTYIPTPIHTSTKVVSFTMKMQIIVVKYLKIQNVGFCPTFQTKV